MTTRRERERIALIALELGEIATGTAKTRTKVTRKRRKKKPKFREIIIKS